MERCTSLGFTFHATHNKNWEGIKEKGLVLGQTAWPKLSRGDPPHLSWWIAGTHVQYGRYIFYCNIKYEQFIKDGHKLYLTKRGMEQKVVMEHRSVERWLRSYYQRFPQGDTSAPLFQISYASVLRWVKKLAALLGAESLRLTTHSFRRSGASELSRQGVPLTDILLYGRWLRERSAREYFRRGEVAVLRAISVLSRQQHLRWQRWNNLFNQAWKLYDLLYQQQGLHPSLSRLDQRKFDLFEECVMALGSTCQMVGREVC